MKLNNYLNRVGISSKLTVNNIFIIFSYLLAIFPLLPFGVRSIIMVLWVCLGIFCFYKNAFKNLRIDVNSKFIIIFLISSYLLLILSLFYSDDKSEGIKKITQMLSFLVIPLVFYLNNPIFEKKIIEAIIKVFCYSVVVVVFYQLLILSFNLEVLTEDLSLLEIKRSNLHHLSSISLDQVNQVKIRRFRAFIMTVVDSHPTYQGLWISFAVFQLSIKLKSKWSNLSYSLPIIFILCVLVCWMFLISARLPILASVFAGILTIVKYGKLHFHSILGMFLFLALVLFGMYNLVRPIKTKVDEVTSNIFKLPTKGNDIYNFNSTNVRSGIYYCDGIVAKDNWLFGTGLGDIQNELTTCYNERIGAKIYTWHKFNSHNQYLFFLISTGLFGLFSFLGLLYYLYRKVVATDNSNMFYFFILISTVFLTENVISRSDGVMFFGLFVSIILLDSKNSSRV